MERVDGCCQRTALLMATAARTSILFLVQGHKQFWLPKQVANTDSQQL